MLLKHTTRTVKAIVKDIPSRLTLDDLSQHPAPGRAGRQRHRPGRRSAPPSRCALDAYADSRRTGSFLLIDPADGTTLTAGMAGDAFADAAASRPRPRRGRRGMGLLTMTPSDVFSTFAKEGGRVGSGALGSGQGGVGAMCALTYAHRLRASPRHRPYRRPADLPATP